MATTSGKFDYEDGGHGLRFTAVSHDLSAACLTEREIDEHRDRLKDDLAAVAARMKAALTSRVRECENGVRRNRL